MSFSPFGPNKQNLEKISRGWVFHMESRVRLSAIKSHINLMENIFGKEYTLSVVVKWYKKALISADTMKNYIDKATGIGENK